MLCICVNFSTVYNEGMQYGCVVKGLPRRWRALAQVVRQPTFWLIAEDKQLTLWCPCLLSSVNRYQLASWAGAGTLCALILCSLAQESISCRAVKLYVILNTFRKNKLKIWNMLVAKSLITEAIKFQQMNKSDAFNKSVAYLGFRKRGAKFSLATSAHTKEGANQVFQVFSMSKKKISAKGGPWPPLIRLCNKYWPSFDSSVFGEPEVDCTGLKEPQALSNLKPGSQELVGFFASIFFAKMK